MKSISGPNGKTLWAATARDPAGRITKEAFANQLSSVRTYDDRGRLKTILTAAQPNGATIQNVGYDWYANGNLFRRNELIGKWTEEFTYDALNRLSIWDSYNLTQNTRVRHEYKFDDLGNLRSKTIPDALPGADTAFYEYGQDGAGPTALTRTTIGAQSSKYGYDPSGNQVTAPNRLVFFNALNLPRRIEVGTNHVNFRYDAAGDRVLRSGPGGESLLTIKKLYQRRAVGSAVTHDFLIPNGDRIVALYGSRKAQARLLVSRIFMTIILDRSM